MIARVREHLPLVLPAGWSVVENRFDGSKYLNARSRMAVIASVEEHDGQRWLHVSCSFPDRLPSWDDLKMVKETFIGREALALQVLPPETEYVNLHPYCLHLWARIDGVRPVPRFTGSRGVL